jgi:hypothetical protein
MKSSALKFLKNFLIMAPFSYFEYGYGFLIMAPFSYFEYGYGSCWPNRQNLCGYGSETLLRGSALIYKPIKTVIEIIYWEHKKTNNPKLSTRYYQTRPILIYKTP